MARPKILGGEMRVIDYLQEHRIELNTVLAAIKPQAFWHWLKWKMLQVWPERDYRRGGLHLETETFRTSVFNQFIEYYDAKTRLVSKDSINSIEAEISRVRGLYDDIEGFPDSVPIVKKAIKGDIMNYVILQDKDIQKMDLALEKIMKDGNSKCKDNGKPKNEIVSISNPTTDNDDDDDFDEDEDDGNEWDD